MRGMTVFSSPASSGLRSSRLNSFLPSLRALATNNEREIEKNDNREFPHAAGAATSPIALNGVTKLSSRSKHSEVEGMLSTSLRSGRDDNFLGHSHPYKK